MLVTQHLLMAMRVFDVQRSTDCRGSPAQIGGVGFARDSGAQSPRAGRIFRKTGTLLRSILSRNDSAGAPISAASCDRPDAAISAAACHSADAEAWSRMFAAGGIQESHYHARPAAPLESFAVARTRAIAERNKDYYSTARYGWKGKPDRFVHVGRAKATTCYRHSKSKS
jgi:hypothetical protein